MSNNDFLIIFFHFFMGQHGRGGRGYLLPHTAKDFTQSFTPSFGIIIIMHKGHRVSLANSNVNQKGWIDKQIISFNTRSTINPHIRAKHFVRTQNMLKKKIYILKWKVNSDITL